MFLTLLKKIGMKKLILGICLLSFLFVGCKTSQQLKRTNTAATESVKPDEPKVYSIPSTNYQEPANNTQSQSSTKTYYDNSKPVRSQSEAFTFAQEGDAHNYQGSYFVILGSFSSPDNANRFKGTLSSQGFHSTVLHSASGYYRVCVNSYANESEARQRVGQIRTDYPKYSDVWLLIKK